jgi:hypothetical protein
LFFSSQGEFVVDAAGNIQLGTRRVQHQAAQTWKSAVWTATGEGPTAAAISSGHPGQIGGFGEIFYIDVSSVAVDAAYNSSSGVITVGIDYPEPYWAKSCGVLG